MPTVSVQAPSARVEVHPGDAVEVRWTSSGARLHDLLQSIDGSVEPIATGLASNVRSHVWTIPADFLEGRVRVEVIVRVVAHGEGDRSEADVPTITVVPKRVPTVPPPPSKARVVAVAIESIDPKSGPITGGTKVTIHGKGFQPFTIARFGPRDAATTFVSETTLHVLSPATPNDGLVDVVLMNPQSTATMPNAFRYDPVPAPSIRAVEPKTGSTAGGTKVTLVGERFAPTTSVSFAGMRPSHTTFVDATTIEIVTPPRGAPGWVDVGVTNIDGQRTLARNAFSYETAPAPEIKSVVPRRGRRGGGERVTLLGKSFAPGAAVLVGDVLAPVRFVDASTLEIETPAHEPGVVDVRVRNPDGQVAAATRAFQFE